MPPSEIAALYLWIVLASAVLMLLVMAAFDGGIRRAIRSSHRTEAQDGGPGALEDIDLIEDDITSLIRSGLSGAGLRIEHQKKGSKLALQFIKYVRAPGDYGIELDFTVFKWARDHVSKIEAYCAAEGLPCRIRPKKRVRGWDVLTVDCGRDPNRAFHLARLIWIEVFGLESTSPHRVRHHGISPFGELVERPDQGPLTPQEGVLRLYPGEVANRPKGCLADLVWVLTFPVVFVGMIVTAAGSPGAPPDWSFEAAGLLFAGTTSSLVFYLLYLGLVSFKLLRRKGPGKDLELPEWLLRTFRGWGLWVRITLPLAVPITWLGL